MTTFLLRIGGSHREGHANGRKVLHLVLISEVCCCCDSGRRGLGRRGSEAKRGNLKGEKGRKARGGNLWKSVEMWKGARK